MASGPGTPDLARATEDLLSATSASDPQRLRGSAPRPISPSLEAFTAAAVDGGSSILVDLGASALLAVRAGTTHRHPDERFEDLVPPATFRLVRRSGVPSAWSDVLRRYAWGAEVEAPTLRAGQGFRPWAEAERSLAEFDAAMQALRALPPDSLLLWDGSLDEDGAAPALREALLRRAHAQRVHVAALSKDSTLTLAGTLPFPLEVEEWARQSRWPPRFWLDVTQALDRHGDVRTYAIRLDARGHVYRVDLPAQADPGAVFPRLARLANDPAYPGYPYPLARIHNQVHFEDAETADLRRALESRVAERRGSLVGMRLFGRGRDVLALGG